MPAECEIDRQRPAIAKRNAATTARDPVEIHRQLDHLFRGDLTSSGIIAQSTRSLKGCGNLSIQLFRQWLHFAKGLSEWRTSRRSPIGSTNRRLATECPARSRHVSRQR